MKCQSHLSINAHALNALKCNKAHYKSSKIFSEPASNSHQWHCTIKYKHRLQPPLTVAGAFVKHKEGCVTRSHSLGTKCDSRAATSDFIAIKVEMMSTSWHTHAQQWEYKAAVEPNWKSKYTLYITHKSRSGKIHRNCKYPLKGSKKLLIPHRTIKMSKETAIHELFCCFCLFISIWNKGMNFTINYLWDRAGLYSTYSMMLLLFF